MSPKRHLRKPRVLGIQTLDKRTMMAADLGVVEFTAPPPSSVPAQIGSFSLVAPSPAATTTNNTMSTAVSMGVAKGSVLTQNGSVGGSDPVDYFKFTTGSQRTSGSVRTTIELSGLRQDLDIFVYNSQGTQIASGRRGGTQSESVTVNLNQNQTYFVKVSPYNSAVSTYTLKVSTPDFAAPITNSFNRDHFGGYVTSKSYATLENGRLTVNLSGRNYRSGFGQFQHSVRAELLDRNGRVVYSTPPLIGTTGESFNPFQPRNISRSGSYNIGSNINLSSVTQIRLIMV
ncbi:PPC domain-containing protein [Aporhodopirellula aestuarii]|uniref:PPC domain-containing protein n=1 Tax=Aporhodopirellula aestuarii TaxID=2950107 RepID=A0ABT0UEA4_9BACT|nr:PPC domain-containing protein [Aporhodopirellula aestuarii]MCM2375107.1 PPC domain-containing protein [Aporhodopirellula aestuarii]